MKFDWKLSSVEEVARHIWETNAKSYYRQLAHYKGKGNVFMVDKLISSMNLLRLWKAQLAVADDEKYAEI